MQQQRTDFDSKRQNSRHSIIRLVKRSQKNPHNLSYWWSLSCGSYRRHFDENAWDRHSHC